MHSQYACKGLTLDCYYFMHESQQSVWGLQIPTTNGGRWLMLATDDDSKFQVIWTPKAKSYVVVVLEALINILHLKVGRHVQKARSDRGKECYDVLVQQLCTARVRR
jgi:hypothetical protein